MLVAAADELEEEVGGACGVSAPHAPPKVAPDQAQGPPPLQCAHRRLLPPRRRGRPLLRRQRPLPSGRPLRRAPLDPEARHTGQVPRDRTRQLHVRLARRGAGPGLHQPQDGARGRRPPGRTPPRPRHAHLPEGRRHGLEAEVPLGRRALEILDQADALREVSGATARLPLLVPRLGRRADRPSARGHRDRPRARRRQRDRAGLRAFRPLRAAAAAHAGLGRFGPTMRRPEALGRTARRKGATLDGTAPRPECQPETRGCTPTRPAAAARSVGRRYAGSPPGFPTPRCSEAARIR